MAGAFSDDTRWTSTVTPNVDHLVRYDKYPRERAVGQSASLVLPDGMPIVWASRLLRKPLRERLAGSDLFALLWPQLAATGTSVVALVASDAVATKLAELHPTASLIVPPMFDVNDDVAVAALVDQVIDAIVVHHPRFVMIGVAMPKHHRLAEQIALRTLPDGCAYPNLLLLGASGEFLVGERKRAPRWMQRCGIEWIHRLLEDPRRMAKRYLVDDMFFLRLLWAERRRRGGNANSD